MKATLFLKLKIDKLLSSYCNTRIHEACLVDENYRVNCYVIIQCVYFYNF